MPSTNLSFAKIVATPTVSTWSQAYNAGSLFIVLSLSSLDEEKQKELPVLGKQILSNLEAEFFGLEEKTFETIKNAVSQSIADLPDLVTLSLSLAYSKDDALYAFVVGNGRISLKRAEKIGIVLENLTSTDNATVLSASGYLESDDLIVIQTEQFAKSVPAKTIIEALEYSLPNDIAETISPHVHGAEEGGATAIILSFKGATRPVTPEPEIGEETIEDIIPSANSEEKEEEKPIATSNPFAQPVHHEESNISLPKTEELKESEEPSQSLKEKLSSIIPRFSLPTKGIQGQKKVILGVSILLVGLIVLGIFFVRGNERSSQANKAFEEVFASAKKDFDEGEGLLTLNKSLARDDYKAAKETLDQASGTFKTSEKQQKELDALSEKINNRLLETEGSSSVTAKEVDASDAPELEALSKDSTLLSATSDEDSVYTLSSKAITSTPLSSGSEKELVKNDSSWSAAKSLSVFSGNLYVLDQKEGLLKFVPAGSGYAESTYFKDDSPDFSKAISMTIDSSIFVLFSDGSIQKYTKGASDSFSLSGLEKEFSRPVSIYTTPDLNNLYVLDPSNTRIVKLDKTGKFESQVSSPTLKDATTLSVSKDEKSAYILAGSKVYQLSL